MKIAIIGAAYTGMEAARYLKSKGHMITVTTTQEARVAELEAGLGPRRRHARQ